jgi:hypothetical protein
MKIFIPTASDTGKSALLGADLKLIEVLAEAALDNVDATGEVFTRNTVSLFNTTLVVPKVLGEAAVLGV